MIAILLRTLVIEVSYFLIAKIVFITKGSISYQSMAIINHSFNIIQRYKGIKYTLVN